MTMTTTLPPAAVQSGGEPTVTPNLKHHLQSLVAGMRPRGYLQAQYIFKRQFIITVLISNNGNRSKTARELGMHRNTFTRTCALLNIDARYIARLCRDHHIDVVRRKCEVIPFGAAQ